MKAIYERLKIALIIVADAIIPSTILAVTYYLTELASYFQIGNEISATVALVVGAIGSLVIYIFLIVNEIKSVKVRNTSGWWV
ncbi:hypothetical protein [Candidatus Thiosymbion oneisti]|uniref:hypothetical protein n=1 Tax=Candidatus Thiosymbion oneisti TaxID=589554 RepID=UPI00114CE481|nr:hypothetical protein [Candidatus Thiosymbion oneisti]